MPSFYLHAPQDFTNLCVIARSLESLGWSRCFVFDPHHHLRERYGKARRQRLRTLSAGAFDAMEFLLVAEPRSFLESYPGRRLATLAAPQVPDYQQFAFERDDLLLLGPEGAGLPDDIRNACNGAITIPLVGKTTSLNLSVSVALFAGELRRQLGAGAADGPQAQGVRSLRVAPVRASA